MMNTRLFLITLIMLSCVVISVQYKFYEIKMNILQDESIIETVKMRIRNDKDTVMKSLNYTGGRNFELISVSVNGKAAEVTHYKEKGNNIIEINLGDGLKPNMTAEVIVIYNTTGYIHNYDNNKMFSIALYFPEPVEVFSFEIKLPPKAVLPISETGENTKIVLFPPGEISSDGRSLILSWYKENIEAGDYLRYLVVYEFPKPEVTVLIKEKPIYIYYNLTQETHDENKKNDAEKRYLILFSLVEAVFVILLIAYLIIKKPKGEKEISKIILKSVDVDEAKILKILLNCEDPLTQRELQDISGFSKAKLSRVLMRLENRGFISRTKYGRTNKIRLTRKITGETDIQIPELSGDEE